MATEPSDPKQGRKSKDTSPAVVGGVVALVVVVIASLVWWSTRGSKDLHSGVAAPEPEAAPAQAVLPPPPPPPLLPEPAAAPADKLDRAAAIAVVNRLCAAPGVARWLATDSVLQRFVSAVHVVARGRSPAEQLSFLAPRGAFEVMTETDSDGQERTYMDPRSYRRFDRVVDHFASIDVQSCAKAYEQVRPLLEEAFNQIAPSDASFDRELGLAIKRVTSVRVLKKRLEVIPRVTAFHFADPELEARSEVEKHVMRMGPRNARRLQKQLRAFRDALGLSVVGS